MKTKLLKGAIDKAKYRGKQCEGGSWTKCILWDTQTIGLGCRILPNQKKFFVLKYRMDNRPRMITLGDYGELTVDDARDKAHEHLAGLKLKNVDPLEERKGRVARSKATIGQLVAEYIERHAKPHKKSWAKDKSFLDRHVLPKWKAKPVSSIGKNDVALLHGKIGKETPYEANRLMEILRKMFNLAADWGYPVVIPNPACGIQRFKEVKRDRWLQADELPKIAQAIDAEENIYIRAALWLYLLVGLRKNELLPVRWEDVDLENRTIYIPDTKSGKPFTAHLSAPAVEILKGIPKLEDNPYVFPGRVHGQHIFDIQKHWEVIREAAKVTDVRLHDLRRTVGSMLATSGVSLLVISKALGHASTVPTEIYARLGNDPVNTALDAHGERLMVAAGKKPPAEIIDFEGAKKQAR